MLSHSSVDPATTLETIATQPNPRIFLSAGEASGDTYGASLIGALRERLPAATFTGLGGAGMSSAGQHQTVRAEDVAVMGITEILRHIPRILSSYLKLVRSIRAQKPDIAVLIDFPDVNFRLAKHLKRAGVPVVWFVSPQLWAWKRSRLRWVQQRVAKMLVIFPFEETFYRERGVDAEFIGHPLAELALPTISREIYASAHQLDPAKTWIALLPGSRWKELRANLPALHELAMSDLISSSAAFTTADGGTITVPANPAAHTRYEFLLPVASTIDRRKLKNYIAELNREHLKYFGPEAATLRLTLVPDASQALHHARASVVASGTATVQAAVMGNPFVVVYRVSALTFALAKKLVRYPDEFRDMPDAHGNQPISMVNLISQERLVPELLQGDFTAANVASALAPLLVDSSERERQISGLARVRAALRFSGPAEASAIGRVADTVVEVLAHSAREKSESLQFASNK